MSQGDDRDEMKIIHSETEELFASNAEMLML